MSRWGILGSVACVVAACGGHTVNLGQSGDGGAPSGDDAGGGSGSSSGSGSNPLSGTYRGYIESFKFPDGSDTIVMTLAFAADGTVTGTVSLGAAALLAPPTDPDVGYPPGYRETSPPDSSVSTLEGFAFTVLGGTFAAPRLTLGLDPNELWKQWCQIQTTTYPQYNSAPDGGCGAMTGFGCLPSVAYQQNGSTCSWTSCSVPASTPVDCGKLALCEGPLGPCTCTATACSVPAPASPGITFDVQLNAGALDGSEMGIGGSVLNVHLVRGP